MAVRHVVYDLAHGPSAGAVGRIQLRGAQPGNGRGEARRRLSNRGDQFRTLRFAEVGFIWSFPIG